MLHVIGSGDTDMEMKLDGEVEIIDADPGINRWCKPNKFRTNAEKCA